MRRWEAVLPLRPEHELTAEAAVQLLALVEDKPVFLGRPEPGVPRRLEDRCGVVLEHWLEPDGCRVRVIVGLHESPRGDQALEVLRSGVAGVGIDAYVRMHPRNRLPVGHPSRHRTITVVHRLNCLEVVPLSAPPQEGVGVAPPLPDG